MAKAKSGGKLGAAKATGKTGAKGAAAGRNRGGSGAAGGAASRGGSRGGNGAGMKSAVVKGEGLEVGNRRREADRAAAPLPRTAAKLPARRVSSSQLPGEKAVKRTDRTIPVEPEREAPGEQEPMPEPALDHRRQIVGTDDKGRRGARRGARGGQ